MVRIAVEMVMFEDPMTTLAKKQKQSQLTLNTQIEEEWGYSIILIIQRDLIATTNIKDSCFSCVTVSMQIFLLGWSTWTDLEPTCVCLYLSVLSKGCPFIFHLALQECSVLIPQKTEQCSLIWKPGRKKKRTTHHMRHYWDAVIANSILGHGAHSHRDSPGELGERRDILDLLFVWFTFSMYFNGEPNNSCSAGGSTAPNNHWTRSGKKKTRFIDWPEFTCLVRDKRSHHSKWSVLSVEADTFKQSQCECA